MDEIDRVFEGARNDATAIVVAVVVIVIALAVVMGGVILVCGIW